MLPHSDFRKLACRLMKKIINEIYCSVDEEVSGVDGAVERSK